MRKWKDASVTDEEEEEGKRNETTSAKRGTGDAGWMTAMLQNNTTTGQHRPETPKAWAESPTFAHWPQLNRPLCIH